jgi:hypothetical protein
MTTVSTGRLLLAAFVALALAAVIAGFLVIGSPARQRQLALDEKRVEHLRQIAGAVDLYWQRHERLPASLDELANEWIAQLRDPETGAPYRYEVAGDERYRLCAVFALADEQPAEVPWKRHLSTHPAGPHCYRLNAGGDRLPFAAPSILNRVE